MTDPRWGDDDTWARRSPYGSEPTPADYPLYPDPAYAGQHYPYGGGYPPPGPDPTRQLPRREPEQPSSAPPPPEPPRSSRGLWLLAGAAILLVVALVIAVLISNDSRSGRSGPPTAAPTLTPSPRLPAPPPPQRPRTPSPTRSPAPTPGTTTAPPTTAPGATSTVGYQVSGEGRAISIAYVGAAGVLRTEFSVTLPWSTEVDLDSATAETAMVTVITAGNEATCTLTVDGAQVQQRSGAFVTICANTG